MQVRGTDAPHLPIIVSDVRGSNNPHKWPVRPGFMYMRGRDATHLPIFILDMRGSNAPHECPVGADFI